MSDEKQNQSKNEKGPLETITDAFAQAQSWYRSVDIKGTVATYREKINNDVFGNPTLKQIEQWPHKPKEIAAEIDRDLRALSTKFNDQFPYVASMCRSHTGLVLGSFVAITVLPVWSRAAKFRTVLKTVIGASLFGQGTLELVNYQWRNDPSLPSDPVTAESARKDNN